MENYIGRLLDNRYEILEVIGTGGMAVVYKALDHRLNRLVAIKILKDEFSRNQEFRRRFHAESQAVAMLSHPNIVSVYDVSRTGDADYIVMELIEGISLKQYLGKKVCLNWRETLHFSMQIAKALEHAHGRGIVHRDIKPHNIMILKDGSIKVADFGIARVGSAQNTLTREALGSVHYISPEQAKGARVDNRSDLYSLGVVMYEMLTGKTPYDGETPVSVAIQHINGGARRPSEIAEGVPGGLEQILLHAMTANIESRYGSATEMIRDMEEFRKNPSMVFLFGAAGAAAGTTNTAPAGGKTTASGAAGEQAARRSTMSRTDAERYAAARAGQAGAARTPEERRAERARREAEEEKKKRLTTLIIVIAVSVLTLSLLIFGVVKLVGFLNGGFGNGDESLSEEDIVEVPKFVGMALEDIDPDDYPDFDVDVENVVYEYSEDYEKGIVMEQSPGAGEEVKRGRTIELVVSSGEEVSQMPDLAEKTEAEAIRLLNDLDLGIKIVIRDEIDNTVPEGKVVRTEPEAGQTLQRNQEVYIYISLGEKKMPDLVGDTKSNAESRLKALNISLKLTFREEESDDVEEGYVIRTDPASGSDLNEGDEIIIYISTGSKNTKVPDVIGQSKDSAIAKLEEAELDYYLNYIYDDLVPEGYVISQSVKPGDKVEKGTTVTIDISLGPEPTESTEPPTEPTEPPTPETTEPTKPTEEMGTP